MRVRCPPAATAAGAAACSRPTRSGSRPLPTFRRGGDLDTDKLLAAFADDEPAQDQQQQQPAKQAKQKGGKGNRKGGAAAAAAPAQQHSSDEEEEEGEAAPQQGERGPASQRADKLRGESDTPRRAREAIDLGLKKYQAGEFQAALDLFQVCAVAETRCALRECLGHAWEALRSPVLDVAELAGNPNPCARCRQLRCAGCSMLASPPDRSWLSSFPPFQLAAEPGAAGQRRDADGGVP